MRLSAILARDMNGSDADITGITADSRAVKPGFLFAALPGVKMDGRAFIADALKRGAVAVIAEGDAPADFPVGQARFIKVGNARLALAQAAARYHGTQPQVIAAVTGTNGKTSIAAFTRQLWQALGHKSASIGTIGIVGDGYNRPLSHTTPDPVALHAALSEMAALGTHPVALEASSHGLDQHRLDGIRIAAAGFSNLTRDHLDYHPTFEDYRNAKLRLFRDLLPPGGLAVVNRDGADAAYFIEAAHKRGHHLIDVGESASAMKLMARVAHLDGQDLTITYAGATYKVRLPLAGGFQAGNALVAAGFVIGLGGDAARTFAALERLEGARGRLERVATARNGAPIFVDYAHTPDALETVLKALRPHVSGKLHVVFGCGGDRDPGKRPQMGAIAVAHADRVIVTDDNPRSEKPEMIRAAILADAKGAIEIGDRAVAIKAAVESLGAGDILVVAGKGHETGQIIGSETRPFDDAEEARKSAGARA